MQVDYVRLGRVNGGVVAENLKPANSGTGASAISYTNRLYKAISPSSACANPSKLWVRVGYSVRWADGKLSKWSVRGPASDTLVCTS